MYLSRVSLFVMGVVLTAFPLMRISAAGPDGRSIGVALDTVRWENPAKLLPAPPYEDPVDEGAWWRSFNDPLLDSLITLGTDRNYNVLMAARRMEIARQTLNEARSLYFPTLEINAGWTKSRTSGAIASSATPATNTSYFSLGADLAWQVDLFGKVTAQARQRKSQWRASRAQWAGVMLSVKASIASGYIRLRLLQAEAAVARSHAESQEKVYRMAQARYEAGLGSQLEVSQAATVYYSTMATIPQLETALTQTLNSLAVLVGEIPGSGVMPALAEMGSLPDGGLLPPLGAPMDLLRRRPDIVAAEAQVAAAADGVGIARKDYLPTLTLNGSIGTSAHGAGDLFRNNSLTYAIAPTLTWTAFDGFRRRYAMESAREEMKAQIDSYNMTVLSAVADVNNAMSAYSTAVREIDMYSRVMEESRKAVELSVDLYRGGLTAFTNVADAQINYLTYTNSWLEARARAISSLITLYQALGGGWDNSLIE